MTPDERLKEIFSLVTLMMDRSQKNPVIDQHMYDGLVAISHYASTSDIFIEDNKECFFNIKNDLR